MRNVLCFNAFSNLKWFGQNNERQSFFHKGFMNGEKWSLTPNKIVSEQEVDSVKY